MSARGVANGFLIAAGVWLVAGVAVTWFWTGDYGLSVGTGLLMTGCVCTGVGVGVRLQEAQVDAHRRWEESQELLISAAPRTPLDDVAEALSEQDPWEQRIEMSVAEARRVMGKPWPVPTVPLEPFAEPILRTMSTEQAAHTAWEDLRKRHAERHGDGRVPPWAMPGE